jgi:hypothetical protein
MKWFNNRLVATTSQLFDPFYTFPLLCEGCLGKCSGTGSPED